MENQNQNTDVGYASGGTVQSAESSAVVITPEVHNPEALSLDPGALNRSPPIQLPTEPRKNNILLRFLRRADIVLVALLIFGLIGVVANGTVKKSRTASQLGVSSRYDTVQIPLGGFKATDSGLSLGTSSVIINGRLTVNQGVVVAPSLQPTDAVAGQMYYDKDVNKLAYYNGTEFIMLGGGVASIQGQTGAVNLVAGPGIAINGTTISNSGVIASGAGGTVGTLAKFTGAQTVADSLLSESGATVTVAGSLSVTGALSLGTQLSVGNGGTGVTTLAANGVLLGQGSSPVTTALASGAGQCLLSTSGAPAFGGCVTTMNSLSGALTIANASASGSTITLDDAGTTTKGIASFSSSNFTVASGAVNTIQDIHTGASPTFTGLTLSGDLAVNGGDITSTGALNVTPGGALVVGATTQALTLQGNASSVITATNGASTTTLTFQTPTANVSYRFLTAAVGTYDVCTSVGNCSGAGVASLDGLTGALTLANSSGVGTTVTIDNASTVAKGIASFNATNFSAAGGVINTIQNIHTGASPTFVDLTLTGDAAINGGDITSTGALNITPTGTLTVGVSTQTLTLQGGASTSLRATSGANTTTVAFAAPTAATTLNFPALAAGTYTLCTSSGNCVGVASTLQTAYDAGNTIAATDARDIAITLTDTATDPNVTITTAAGGAGFTTFALADGANAAPPSQLLLVRNNDTNQALAAGLKVTSAAGGITTALDVSGTNITNALAIGANAISGTNFSVTGGGAVTAVGVNAGAGLLQGAFGLTISGAAVSLNNNSNFATNINTGTSSGTITLGGGSAPLVIDSTNFDVSSAGAVSGVTTLNTSGIITQGTLGAADNLTYLCRNSSNQIASCNAAGAGAAFVQGGNTFGATATLGTNDANQLDIRTNSTTRLTVGAAGGLTVAANNSLSLASGTGTFTQTYTGTTTDAHTITANSLTTATALKVTSSNNSAADTAWSAVQFNPTNAQGTTAVSTGIISGLDIQFTQNPSIAGNTETVANFAVKQNDSSATDSTVASILNLANNDTATGNQITVTDGLKITGTNVTNGINLSGTFGTNLITSTNFSVSQAGAIVGVGVNAGTGSIQGTGGMTVSGATANINVNSNFATNINTGSSTGTITLGGGLSPLVIDSTNFDVSSAGALSGITTIATSSTINSQTISAAANFTGTVTIQGSNALTLGVTGSATGAILLKGATAASGTITLIGQANPTGSQTITLPDATGTVCLTTGNCAGSGTGVTSALGGTANRLAKFTAAQNIENSTISDDGVNVTTSVDLIIQGGDATLGVASSQTGSLNFKHSGSANTGTITQGALTGAQTYTLPNSSGSFCLTSGNCAGAGSSNTLQAAYDAGNTIATTDARDIAITLTDTATDPNVTIATAAGGAGFTTFSLTDGANASPPAQLVLVRNNDTNQAVAAGLKVTSAAGTITTALDASGTNITNALAIGANAITGTNFSVTGAGAITAVGVNAGAGLLQGALGLTVTGAAVSLNNNSNFATNINTGTSSGTITLGGGSAPLVIDSTNFDVSSAGAVSGVTTLNTSGIITQGTLGAADNPTYLCRNSSNQIASCNTTGAGAAFVQGGNTFGATATLGTNDTNQLDIRTNGVTRLSVAALSGVTLAANNNLIFASGVGGISQTYTGTTSAAQFISGTSLTTAALIDLTVGTAMTTGHALRVISGTYVHTAAETGNLIDLNYSDTTSAAFATTTNGINIASTINTTGSSARTFAGLNYSPTLTACGTTGGTCTLQGVHNYLPALTQTTTNTFNMYGSLTQSSGALIQNTAAGTINWYGNSAETPNITQTTGSVNAIGSQVSLGTITTGGSQYGLRVAGSSSNAAGTETGLQIDAITPGAANEYAIVLGSGWDDLIRGTTAGTNLFNFTNFVVTSGGAVTAVGVNAGTGLIQGTGGATLSGATISLNANSNFATNINTGTSNGTITLGGGSAPLVIDSTNFDVSSAGALSGITTIATSGTINSQTISSAANFTGTLGVASDTTLTGDIAVNGGDITSSGALNITPGGALTVGATTQTLTLQGGASTKLTATSGASTTTLAFTSPIANTTLNLPALSAGTYNICTSSGNCAGVGATLQTSYDNGNTINTSDARDIALTLADTSTDGNLTITTATGSTGFTSITRADGGGAADPAQLLLIKNNDTDRAQPIGLRLQSAAGGLTTAIDASGSNITTALSVGANAISGTTGNISYTNFILNGTSGTLTLSSSSTTTFTTPVGSSVPTKINIPIYDPGAFGQVVALGINAGGPSSSSARVLSLFDARATVHQPTLAVFDPSENNIAGINWNGASTAGYFQTNDLTSGNTAGVILQSGNVTAGNGSSGDVYASSGSIAGGTGGSSGALFLQTGNGTGTNSSSGSITLDSGSKTGSGTSGGISIGTTNTTAITVGNAGNNSSITLNSGTGTIAIGTGAQARSINIGTGGAAQTVVLGSTNSTSTTTVQSGTGHITLQAAGSSTIDVVQIGAGGAGSTTPDFLALDVKSDTGDPAGGAEGYMYYNTFDNKFRCYQGAAWADCITTASATTLQAAYDAGNTIAATDARDIAITLANTATDPNVTITTAAGGAGFTSLALADGSNAAPPAQLLLVKNNDTNQALGLGISVQSAAGGVTTAFDASGSNITNALSIGANAIAGTNFSVTGGGAVTAVGVNSGAGLLQGVLGLTISGAAVSLNNNSNFATNINTGTSNALVSIGGGSGTFALDTTNIDISSAGAITGATGITMASGNFLQSGAGTFGTGTGAVSLNGDTTIAAGKNFALASGAGTFTQTFTGSGTAHTITANSLAGGAAFKVDSSNNSGANTAWSAIQLNPTNAQTTAAVTSLIAGLDVKFTQNASIAGNTETVANFRVKQIDTSVTDNTVASILNVLNEDTATGNQVTVTDGIKVTGTNVTNGLNLSGTFGTNLITSTNFSVSQAGAIVGVGVDSGTSLIQGTGGLTVSGTINLGSVGTSTAASTIHIADTSDGTGTQTITIGTNAKTANVLTLDAGTGATAIQIGNSATAHGIQIGSGAAVQTVVVGSTNSTSALTLQAGTGNLQIQTQGGTLGVGNNSVAQTLQIGNTTGATAVTIDSGTGTIAIGTGAQARTINIGNGAAVQTMTIGSTNSTSALTLQAGTGNLKIQTQGGTLGIGDNAVAQTITVGNATGATTINLLAGTGNINIGTSDTTGTLLVLDTDTDTTETTGVAGAMYYNSSMARMRCYYDSRWRFCGDNAGLTWGYDFNEDFLSGGDTNGRVGERMWQKDTSGTGASVTNVAADVATRPGQEQFSTGTTTTGYANIFSVSGDSGSTNPPFYVSGGEEIEMAINIPTLATGTQDYAIRVGMCDNNPNAGTDCGNGVYYEYKRATSLNWIYATAKASTQTKTTSSTAVTTGWHRLKITVNSAGTSIDFAVDGTSLGTAITTNIPNTSSNLSEPSLTIIKSAGTTARTFTADYFQWRNTMTTAR